MPPNAKKRKAAKKKQKNQSQNANNTSSASTHSNDDVKRHDDVASQNRDQRKTLIEVNKETTKNGESAVQTDRGVKIEDISIEKDGKIEQIELSSGSEYESCVIIDSPAVEGYSVINPVEATDLLSETPRVDEITLCVEEAEVKSSSEDKVGISDPKECEVQVKDDRLTTSNGASKVRVNDEAEGDRYSVTQPLLERPLQRSSLKSCCGLFELFTGSAS